MTKEKKKRVLLKERVLEYLVDHRFTLKAVIAQELGLKIKQLDKPLTVLKKEKKITLYKHRYWGV